jgi:signal transduction histidine kinase
MRRLNSTWADALLAAAITVVYVLEVVGESGFAGDRPESFVAAVIFGASLAWRRRVPMVPLALAIGIVELSNYDAPQLAETAAFLFGFVIAIYSAGAYTEGRTALAAALFVVIAIPLAAIEPGVPTSASDWGFFVMFLGGPYVAGRVMRRRRLRERTLEGRAEVLEREGEERSRVAIAEERARIARELHDAVSHSLSVMLLQARGARKILPEDGGPAREALEVIERSGSEALQEMRRLLGVLREIDTESELAPQPSLKRIDSLVEPVRAAGMPVEVTIEGEVDDLPPGVDVSAYRIVQEALTNALKHAGPARARVFIRRTDEELELEVIDDGEGSSNGDGTGQGLVGMRERVAVYGGKLDAGPHPGGGYALRARLPIGSTQ